VLSVSTDAVVHGHQLLGNVLGIATESLSGVVETTNVVDGVVGGITGVLDPATSTTGAEVSPSIVRQTLGVPSTWSGRGVGVAVIDSGLDMSAEFTGHVAAFYNFLGGQATQTWPSDEYGHGTHIAGTIAGSGALSQNYEYRGLAPKVTLTILKVLDANGAGYTSDVVRAIDFAVANRAKYGIDIINLSLGHPIFEPAASDPLVLAVERASKAGIIVTTAAGNIGVNPKTGQTGYAGSPRPAMHRRRSRLVPSRRCRRSRARTIAFPTTAPPVRPGSTDS
jgi:subtilisin family serine protease